VPTSTVSSSADSPGGSFAAWLQDTPTRTRVRGRAPGPPSGGLRFAFYGRISTAGYPDPTSSRGWQVEAAGRLVSGRGRIVMEFFDQGSSRSVPWGKRPQAAALLAAAADPGRGFDAVVVGEFERAFTGGQAMPVIALLNLHGVQVWLPEARGPVDLNEPDHRALVMMLGHQAEREVLRSRFRTTAAMRALPDGSTSRRGVPQSAQPHVLRPVRVGQVVPGHRRGTHRGRCRQVRCGTRAVRLPVRASLAADADRRGP
jgi:DNA invertase Pin-like site-specific DNA recombinase